MKNFFILIVVATMFACSKPLRVTGKTDVQATTSGTMGSVKASNQMPALDTPVNKNRIQTLKKQ